MLMLEFDNDHDPNAIRIEVGGRHVAYLSRADAAAYRPLLLELYDAGFVAACRALILGRDVRDPDSQTTNLGVFLDIADPDGCRAALGL
jgi:hypothetical protein